MTLITSPAAEAIIGCAIKVHRTLGAGLFESVYHPCLAHEFGLAGLRFRQQMPIPLRYDTLLIPAAFRADFIVEDEVIVELKSLETVHEVHFSQVLTYLKLTGLRKGLLINFNVPLLKNGLKSFVT